MLQCLKHRLSFQQCHCDGFPSFSSSLDVAKRGDLRYFLGKWKRDEDPGQKGNLFRRIKRTVRIKISRLSSSIHFSSVLRTVNIFSCFFFTVTSWSWSYKDSTSVIYESRVDSIDWLNRKRVVLVKFQMCCVFRWAHWTKQFKTWEALMHWRLETRPALLRHNFKANQEKTLVGLHSTKEAYLRFLLSHPRFVSQRCLIGGRKNKI